MSESAEQASARQSQDTFPRLLFFHGQRRPDKIAVREKDLGIWQSWSWSEVAENVAAMAAGLAELGFKRGDNLAIIGDNRPRLYWTMAAVQSLGGVPVPLYQDAIAQEMKFVLDNAEIKFAIVEDQEQVDKLLEIKEEVPQLAHILYDDPRGMRHYTQPFLHAIDAVMELGRVHNRNHPDFIPGEVAKGRSDDTAIMLYTSGTTGNPKGVCHTHASVLAAARGGVEFDGLRDDDEVLSYLPMAWVGDFLFSFGQQLVSGFAINCPESGDTVMTDMREIGPTYYFAPPRVYENLLTTVLIRMEDAGTIKRKMFHHFMDVAKRCGSEVLDGKPVSAADRFQYALGNLLVYGPLRNVLGMSRIRVAYTAGAAISPDLFKFYRSIGINLKQLYGSTETVAYVCLQPDGDIRFDTVGKPAPGVEVKIADNGEVVVKATAMLKEYYKRPDSTAEAFNAEGYFLTGDAGYFDPDGHLKIIDRAKDVGKTADGTMFAPNYIENKLKFFTHIKEAVAFGHDRKSVTAFINVDPMAVGDWLERRNLSYSGYPDMAGKPEVYELIKECVEKVNADLAADPKLSGSQISRFLVLPKELDADDGELTRTRKVRRNFIADRYAILIDALYGGAQTCHIETVVKYEDGRSGKIEADVRICDAKTFPPSAPQAAARKAA
jgi:long-chain acyl-CoA synthetase